MGFECVDIEVGDISYMFKMVKKPDKQELEDTKLSVSELEFEYRKVSKSCMNRVGPSTIDNH